MRIEIYYRFIGKTSDCLNRSVTPPHKNKNRIRRCNGFYCLTYVVRKK